MTRLFQRSARQLSRKFALTGVLLSLLISLPVQASNSPTITLIIDDIGYNLRNGMRAVSLPGAISYAVLPHTPYSKRLAKTAHQMGKTVMLHAPMTNVHQRAPGPGTLSPAMDQSAFTTELSKALDAIPFVQGVNNHMGSELTQDKMRMQWLMEEVAKRRLFFIDSRTTAASVAAITARANGIPSMSRDVFLDHIRTPEAVNEAFDTLIRLARRNGHAVGIGHPHSVTLDMLEARLPELKAKGIRLISVPSQLVAMGQVYQDIQPAALPVDIAPPAQSPVFWSQDIHQLSRFTPVSGAEPAVIRKEIISRKPLPSSEVEAIERKLLLPEILPGTEFPVLKPQAQQPVSPVNAQPLSHSGFKPATDTGHDLSLQPYKEPEWLTPVSQQPWNQPNYRTLPGITSTP